MESDRFEMVLRFQLSALYNSCQLADLLQILRRRGGQYLHLGDGIYELTIPPELDWTPFHKTIQDCPAVSMATVVSRKPVSAEESLVPLREEGNC